MATRPLVLPEIYDVEKLWEEWIYHFESMVEMRLGGGREAAVVESKAD